MITAHIFMLINILGWALAIFISPFWGLLVYANIYFNPPFLMLNWWAGYLPDIRWSLVASAVLAISMLIHRKKISKRSLGNAWWIVAFFCLNVLITLTWGEKFSDALIYNQMLLAFCFACFFIIKTIRDEKDLRLFLLVLIGFAAQLSIKAYLYGKRIHARLEYTGTPDAYGSNEFALLLAGILPLTIPFILKGKWYERLICILSLPFIINAFILCNSRGAVVALVLSTLIVLIFFPDKQIRKGIIITLICAIPLFLYLSDPEFIERISTLKRTQHAYYMPRIDTNELSSGRLEIWKYGLEMVNDYPFGAGPNGFKYLSRFYIPQQFLTLHPGEETGVRAAHNTYLQVLVEQGYLGLIFFIIMCFQTLRMLRTSMYRLKSQVSIEGFWLYAVLALSLSFLSIIFGGMFNSRFYYEFFWWQIAIIVVAYSCLVNMGGGELQNDRSTPP